MKNVDNGIRRRIFCWIVIDIGVLLLGISLVLIAATSAQDYTPIWSKCKDSIVFTITFLLSSMVAVVGAVFLKKASKLDLEDNDSDMVSKYKIEEATGQKLNKDGKKYPVSLCREKRGAGSLGIIKIIIDGQDIADLKNGEKVKFQLVEGIHKISFCFGSKVVKSMTFSVGENGDGATITCFVNSNWTTTPVVEAKVSNIFVESMDSPNNSSESSGIGFLGTMVAVIMIVVGLWLFLGSLLNIIFS